MIALLAFVRGFLAISAAIVFAFVVSVAAPPVAEAPGEPQPAVIVATTSPKSATTTLAVASTTPAKPIPAKATSTLPSKPKPADPAPTPKVEDLKITLNQAIQSITDLASAASTTPVNERVRSALVNIICTTQTGGPLESISASGVIIDPRGVIITNAHAAQFFLLKDYPSPNFVSCYIRTGSPASPKYTAELLFLPPTWIDKNAEKIIQENPTGNGEHDYAFLRITGSVSPSVPLPSEFPFVLTAINSAREGIDVLVAGYAAGFLGGITVAKDLYAVSAFSKIGTLYTYGTDTADLYSVGGTIVAQRGSSGGAVTTTDGTLIGVIVTSTQAENTANRDLRAVATSYIIRDFESERGKSLESVLSNDLKAEAETFSRLYATPLTQKLITALEK